MTPLLLLLVASAPPAEPLKLAIAAYRAHQPAKPLLVLIDYSRPSRSKRLWLLDVTGCLDQPARCKVLLHERVAHGKGSDRGGEAVRFSNEPGSRASSLGAYLTLGTYVGQHGRSLKLRGLERGRNHLAEPRAIVMHGAWYATASFAKKHGRLGRSWGCPAVAPEVVGPLIDRIQRGSLLFIYHPAMRD